MSYHKAGISQARQGCAGSGADLRARGHCAHKQWKHGYMPAVELMNSYFPDLRKLRRHLVQIICSPPILIPCLELPLVLMPASCPMLSRWAQYVSSRRKCPCSRVRDLNAGEGVDRSQAGMPSSSALFCKNKERQTLSRLVEGRHEGLGWGSVRPQPDPLTGLPVT